MRVAIVKEDLWAFRGILGDLDDVAVSSAGAPALEGTFLTHDEIRQCWKISGKRDRTARFCRFSQMLAGYLLKDPQRLPRVDDQISMVGKVRRQEN